MSKTTRFDSRIKKYAYCEASQIYQELGASPDGLSDEQVREMRETYGANSFAARKRDTTTRRLRRAFLNPFSIILFILGVISLATDVFLASNFARNATTAIIIFSMILISGVIRLIQELRAKNAAQQLERLIHESITVKRKGKHIELPAEDLVVGDIVLLSAGDRVPADIRLTEVTDLFISQAAITGESAILEKRSHRLSHSEQETLTQLENLALMATTVISGKGEGIVLAVGGDTLYGSFAKPDPEDKKSFQHGANSIAWVMLRFMAVLIPIVFVLLGITGGRWLESFAFALSVAVGLTPEMLPMVITACLARGSLTMSRKQTILKDINAMQGFGSMDVLCMDKTGTLTQETILLEYYMDERGELLTMEEFFEAWTKWKNEKYHTREHRGLKDAGEKWITPISLFENGERYEKAAPPREYAAMLLMRADTARVTNQGINKFGTLYTDYELCHYVGKHVGIKWDIDDVTKLYVFDQEGRKIYQQAQKGRSLHMARKRVVEPSGVKTWEDANDALRQIAEAQLAVQDIEGEMNKQILGAKKAAEEQSKPHKDRIAKLERELKDFVTEHRADMGKAKSKILTFGEVGFRLSTSVSLPRAKEKIEEIIRRLKNRQMMDCIVVKEDVSKEALKKYGEDTVNAVGATWKQQDVFGYELDFAKLEQVKSGM